MPNSTSDKAKTFNENYVCDLKTKPTEFLILQRKSKIATSAAEEWKLPYTFGVLIEHLVNIKF